jgi:hypothetical protein
MKNNNTVPIGAILQDAGLVNEKQINVALKTQKKYNKLLLGEILVLQGRVKRQTINFFVEQWEDLQKKGKQYPIGYYLKKAGLLNEQQIKSVLLERQKTQLNFGTLVVKKGWLNQTTIDFFLENLPAQPIQPISFQFLEKYNRSNLHLETKADDVNRVLQEIINWTNGHPILTKMLCKLIKNHNSYIVKGREKFIVENIVKHSLINDWKKSKITDYIRILENGILNNQNCNPYTLLRLYRRVLLQKFVPVNNSEEQQELLILGLLIEKQKKLKVANRLYPAIFNLDWVETNLKNLQEPNLQSVDNQNINVTNKNNEPLAKIASIAALIVILSPIPWLIFLKENRDKSIETEPLLSSNNDQETLREFCNSTIPQELIEIDDNITKLERSQQQLQTSFPNECEILLHKLWVLAAPTLGKDNRAIEAIDNLCQIPSESPSFNQAKFWIDRWYYSPTWGTQTKSYLNLISNCPAAENK